MSERVTPEEIRRDIRILRQSADQQEVTAAAIALAGAEDAQAIHAVGELLASQEGLARLDDLSDPSVETLNLQQVFRALADHPTEATGRLCEELFAAEQFRTLPARVNMLLAALAALQPTSARGAEVLRAAIGEGYAEVVAPLLLRNASPLSLEVFEELIRSDQIEAYVKVDILHRALLPTRYKLPVLVMCERLLEASLPVEVRAALIETLFDYQSRRWFGPAMYPPKPLDWEFASTEALRALVALGSRLLGEQLDTPLRSGIQGTLNGVEALLRTRQ